jgi:hypothetical protein
LFVNNLPQHFALLRGKPKASGLAAVTRPAAPAAWRFIACLAWAVQVIVTLDSSKWLK